MRLVGLVEDIGHLIWAISYGPSHIVYMIWTISYERYRMDHIILSYQIHFCMNFNSKSTNWKTKILFEKPVIIGFENDLEVFTLFKCYLINII